MLPFTPYELAEAVERGEVTARRHPTLPYTIFNYSPEVQYTNRWNDITLNCRGLILDDEFNIIARPWKKFFNLGQVNLPIQMTDPVEVMDKADGSLGILYPTPDGFAISTRGSFESEQAKAGSKIWNESYSGVVVPDGFTFLFEILLPWNRIVLNYDYDSEYLQQGRGSLSQRFARQDVYYTPGNLVLLGAVENRTGYYHGPREAAAYLNWTGPVVKVFDFNTISDALGHMERENAEGYVIRSHNFMVKLKQPDYLELHRLVTNASPKAVWEQLKSGKSKSEIVSAFPDEFHDYIGSMVDPLVESYEARCQEIFDNWSKVMDRLYGTNPGRKDYAAAFAKHKDKKYFFLLLDGKAISDVVWTELRPKVSALESVAS